MKSIPLHGYSPPRRAPLPPEEYRRVGAAFHFTVKAYRGCPFTECAGLAETVIELIREYRCMNHCAVGAYCVMPNHLHLIAAVRQEGGDARKFASQLKGRSTNESWKTGWTGKLWQGGLFDQGIPDETTLIRMSEYILNNPVRAGLVKCTEDWPWSGVMDPEWFSGDYVARW